MTQVTLYCGCTMLCDEEDLPHVTAHKWRAPLGYAHARFQLAPNKRLAISFHRLVMNAPKGMEVDHINHNTLDNRKANLRIVTRAQNTHWSRSHPGSTSQYKGVSFDKSRTKWIAMINLSLMDLQINIGRFDSEIDAARAYDRVAFAAFGEYAFLNFPEETPIIDDSTRNLLIHRSRTTEKLQTKVSQYHGVSYLNPKYNATKRWRAQLRVGSKNLLGSYHMTEIEAACAYDDAVRQHGLELSRLNFPTADESERYPELDRKPLRKQTKLERRQERIDGGQRV